MLKRPAQHTAATFINQRGIGVLSVLLVIFLFPILLVIALAVKIGVVLGLHLLVQMFTGSWFILSLFGALTALFTLFGFISRVAELGRYYTGLRKYYQRSAERAWYAVVFAVDFLVTDMLTLSASAILAYTYWVSAVVQNYTAFSAFAQPFLTLSILGGLLQILFSAYYLTHPKLDRIYHYATGIPDTRVEAYEATVLVEKPRKSVKTSKKRKSPKKKATRKTSSKKRAKNAKRSKKASKKSTKRRSTKRKTSRKR